MVLLTTHFIADLVAHTCSPTHTLVASVAGEAVFPPAGLLVGHAWDFHSEFLSQRPSSSLLHLDGDVAPLQLLSADLLELLGQDTIRGRGDDEEALPHSGTSRLLPVEPLPLLFPPRPPLLRFVGSRS